MAIKNETVDLTTPQTIAGVKNFSSRPQFNSADLATVSQIPTNSTYVDMTTNQTVVGVKNFSSRPQFNGMDLATTGEAAAGGGATITDYVKLTTDQTIAGIKTFNNTPKVLVGGNSKSLALVSDIPTNSTYVDMTTNQTVAGTKTFSSAPTFSAGADFNANKIANAVPEITTVTSNLTLDATHNGKIIMVSTALGGITITTPVSTPVLGYNVSIIQVGASPVTIAPGSGATLLSFNNQYKTAGLYAAISIVHWGANNIIMYGNTTA